MLVEHPGIRRLEQRFAALRSKLPFGKMQYRVLNLRGTFRSAVRSVADCKQKYAESKNGDLAFLDWRQGFEFAQSLPSGTAVVYARFSGASDAVFFFSERALRELNNCVVQFDKDLRELEDLVKAQEALGVDLSKE